MFEKEVVLFVNCYLRNNYNKQIMLTLIDNNGYLKWLNNALSQQNSSKNIECFKNVNLNSNMNGRICIDCARFYFGSETCMCWFFFRRKTLCKYIFLIFCSRKCMINNKGSYHENSKTKFIRNINKSFIQVEKSHTYEPCAMGRSSIFHF